MAYDYKKTIKKMCKYTLYYGIPALLTHLMNFYPEISTITLGSIITGIINYLKHREKPSKIEIMLRRNGNKE